MKYELHLIHGAFFASFNLACIEWILRFEFCELLVISFTEMLFLSLAFFYVFSFNLLLVYLYIAHLQKRKQIFPLCIHCFCFLGFRSEIWFFFIVLLLRFSMSYGIRFYKGFLLAFNLSNMHNFCTFFNFNFLKLFYMKLWMTLIY